MMNAGEVLEGRYEIIKIVGKGGMSTVYQAKDLTSGKILAIKDAIRTGKGENQAVEQKLVDEGNMLKQLANRHLPKIYDILERPDSFMLVMDFIQGESLDRVVQREGAQPVERVLDWGMQICEVFDYLHNQATPIIYRDMKPANLMLQPNGQLMMIDFGTARNQKVGVAMAADTLCLGTAGFAAPEQFGGIGQSTPRTDIFCLGATLYNLVTGHSPCDRPQGILPLENWNPALKDSPISYIIYKCTRNDPDARYQTARELYDDLYKALNGTFGDPSTWGKSGKLTGGISRDWQKQNVKISGGISGGLSGLLQFGKTQTTEKAKVTDQKSTATIGCTDGWQRVNAVGAVQQVEPCKDNPEPKRFETRTAEHVPVEVPAADDGRWKKLTTISLAIAVVMVLFGLVMIGFKLLTAGLIFIIIALGAAVLAAAGIVFSKRMT